MNLHQWHSIKRYRHFLFDLPSAKTTKTVAEPLPSSASVQEVAFGSESHVEIPKCLIIEVLLGLSLTMYGVTTSRAKKKAGLNQAHKPGPGLLPALRLACVLARGIGWVLWGSTML